MTTTPVPRPVELADLHRLGLGEHATPHTVLGAHADVVGGAGRDAAGTGAAAADEPQAAAEAARAVMGGELTTVVTVRALAPFARSVVVVTEDGARSELAHEHEGVWAGVLPGQRITDYRLEITYPDGEQHAPEGSAVADEEHGLDGADGTGAEVGAGGWTTVVDDPYRYLPTISEFDLHLVSEGRHEELWGVLGAHVRRYSGPLGEVTGTSFAVWAPRARAVRVIGDFNGWDGRRTMMRSLGSSGVWELFLPHVGKGAQYKFALLTADGRWVERADPMARATEVPPSTASVVTESEHVWGDEVWMARRAATDPHAGPMSTYEVHLGSWKQGLGYREAAEQLVAHVQRTGFTHVELLPVAEHPFGGSWGYQVTGYYAPTSRFGDPDDFRHLVDRLHQAGIGVILDWVPAHFPKDEWALARFDGEPLYEYPDPRKGEHPDWGTLVFDFGRREVRNFLVANALYWLMEFHIDGLRVDAVASMLYLDYSREGGQWIPNKYGGREHLEAIDFLQEVNATAYRRVPGIITIAEESTSWPGVTRPTDAGGLGFGLKWNMGWMHDSLRYLAEDPVNRTWHHDEVTFSLVYAFSENFLLPISHDEVVHGKGSLLRKVPGDRWQQLATLRAFYAYMWAHPGKQLLFMGQEFGQEAEWAESRSLDWWLVDQPLHAGLMDTVSDLNRLYREIPALWEQDSEPAGFAWVDSQDREHNTFSFVRYDRSGRPLVAVVNFAGVPHEGYRLGLPRAGAWREVLNTDAEGYGGSGVVNSGELEAREEPHSGQPASAVLRVPPLGALWLVPAEA
jgi:1,4-alpha-glucan branching enzyme